MAVAGVQAADDRSIVLHELSYGDAAGGDEQRLDLYTVDRRERRPVVVFVHGGGWAFGDKAEVGATPGFFLANGLAFVSINYRLRWEHSVADQLADVARAIRWVVDHGEAHGLDPERLILLGVEAGAHLASLVGSDERYLKSAGLTFDHLRVVAAVSAMTYDLPAFIAGPATFLQRRHLALVFGTDAAEWARVSPALQVKPGMMLPSFVLMYPADDVVLQGQANAFAQRLGQARGGVITIPMRSAGAAVAESALGQPGDASSMALLAFIRARL